MRNNETIQDRIDKRMMYGTVMTRGPFSRIPGTPRWIMKQLAKRRPA